MHLFQATWGQNDKFSTTLLNKCTCLKIGWDIGPENWLENWPENWPGKFARKLAQKINWKMVRKSSRKNVGKWPENLPKNNKMANTNLKNGPACPAMAGHNHSKPAMASHGQPWPAVASHGQPWLPTAAEPMGPKDPTPSKTKRPNTVQDPRTPDSGTGWIELENATG